MGQIGPKPTSPELAAIEVLDDLVDYGTVVALILAVRRIFFRWLKHEKI